MTATYTEQQVDHWAHGSTPLTTPIPPPHGTVYVSDLSFVSAINGWGPVEHDTSNGEQQAGDGHPISIRGTTYANGLGVHANGDVALYLGGNCMRFTTVVGIADEVAAYGSVRFSVVADGTTLVTTPLLTRSSPALPIDVDVSGARQLDLIINDGETATPTTTVTGPMPSWPAPKPGRFRFSGGCGGGTARRPAMQRFTR